MKATLPRPVHESYLRHRKEVAWRIVLPVVLSLLVIIAVVALIVNVTFFQNAGDVSRWAAISTIWIVIPTMVGMLIFLALLIGMVYLLARLLNITPTYTGMAQDYVYKAVGYIKRAADAAVKPVLQIERFMAGVNAFFGRK